MSGRRFRRAAAAAALGLGAVLGALAALYGRDTPAWSIPFLAAAVLVLCELVSLSRGPAPDAAVERPAVTAVVAGRLLVPALLAFAAATVTLLAAALPARHGPAIGLLGAAAATALFLVVAALARREPRPEGQQPPAERCALKGSRGRPHRGSRRQKKPRKLKESRHGVARRVAGRGRAAPAVASSVAKVCGFFLTRSAATR